MKVKLVLFVMAMASGTALLVQNFGPDPVYSVRRAEAKREFLNAYRHQFQCGRWLVHERLGGEGRLSYDATGCPILAEPRIKAYLDEHNERMLHARTIREIDEEQAALQSIASVDGSQERTKQQSKGMDEAYRKLSRDFIR